MGQEFGYKRERKVSKWIEWTERGKLLNGQRTALIRKSPSSTFITYEIDKDIY